MFKLDFSFLYFDHRPPQAHSGFVALTMAACLAVETFAGPDSRMLKLKTALEVDGDSVGAFHIPTMLLAHGTSFPALTVPTPIHDPPLVIPAEDDKSEALMLYHHRFNGRLGACCASCHPLRFERAWKTDAVARSPLSLFRTHRTASPRYAIFWEFASCATHTVACEVSAV